MISNEEYKARRKMNVDATFRKMLGEKLGSVCVNCGSTKGVEFHHIVPLKLGGSNSISNIVPLCQICHKAVTHGGSVSQYKDTKGGGRHASVSKEEAYAHYDLWARGGCCTTELREDLKLSERTHVKEGRWYEDWKNDRRIQEVKNTIEFQARCRDRTKEALHWRDVLNSGELLSTIQYVDGTIEKYYHVSVPVREKKTRPKKIKVYALRPRL